jgi:RNA polymerase sigma-70 factor (ECF subfamily)
LTAADEEKIDPAVVARLYAQHGEELKRFLLGLLRDAQLAGDVLQATFVKLAERGHETREESRKSWLFRVAFHEAMLIRRRSLTGEKAVERLAWIKRTTGHSADEPVIRFEAVERVREAMAELPPDQRQIVHMRVYEEKTFAVIATELKIPLGTALARMRSAVKKLRKQLDELQ